MKRTVYADKLDPALVQPLIDGAAKYGITKATFPAATIIDPERALAKRRVFAGFERSDGFGFGMTPLERCTCAPSAESASSKRS